MHDPATVQALRDAHQASGARLAAAIGGWARLALAAVLTAAFVRVVIAEPFNIPSASMNPGLVVGDHLFVDKTAYGWSRASVPLGLLGEPVTWRGRLFGRLPARGDVAVFVGPGAGRIDYVKRVIGLPGDRIALRAGTVILNGRALACRPVAGGCRETLGARSYTVTGGAGGAYATMEPLVIPAGHVFVLGDNRADSADSRVSPARGGVGLVPVDALVGRAARVFLSFGAGGVRWDRAGLAVR
jgi:signal peptidase I